MSHAASTDQRAPGGAGRAGPAGLICPCCGARCAEFLPAGGRRKLPNRKCPGCGSLERHRALWLYMVNRTNLLRDQLRVLHFSPMPALRALLGGLPNVDCVTADLDGVRAELRMDMADNLFRDDVFDAVLAVHVLEHVPDDRRAMREAFRVLKPGGWAILHSPIEPGREVTFEDPSIVTPEERERVFGQRDHVRAYGHDYPLRLRQAGFHVRRDNYLRRLGPEVAARHRLGSELEVFFCVKPTNGPDRNGVPDARR
jgi:SAM-dependent methyltransferase